VNTRMRRAAVAVAAPRWPSRWLPVAVPRSPATRPSTLGQEGDAITVGLLLPENQTARYEKFDKPLIEKKVKELTNNKGKIVYANAKQDATTADQQVDTMITNKVDVLIVDAVDSKAIAGVKKAKDAGIPVVAYDRLAEGPIDAYTSFDNEEVGRVQGKALLTALGSKAKPGEDRHDERRGHRPQRRPVQEGRAVRAGGQGHHRQGVRHEGVEAGERQRQHGRPRSPRSARTRSSASTPPTTAWRAASSPP
jgi:ABC-type sugar transport system substrate-binding protein